MITLNRNESKSISFDISVQGVEARDLKGSLRMNLGNVECGFPIKIVNESIQVTIPSLRTLLKENIEGPIPAKLEIVAGDTYIVPWEDTIKIESPVVVEAKVKDIKKEKPTLNIGVKKIEEKIEEPKKTVEAKPKSRFGKMLQE